MTTAAEGRELTQVGPGTVMGELMRQYWIPAAPSTELVRDGAPIRLMLLGEKLIAFRDTEGRVGVMDHRCPHRCASLFLGRNEEGGIRCIYHGWKYDVAGNCIDMASVPPHQDFKHKVKARAYPAVERAGVVWVYMGSRAEAPPLPGFEILDVPDDEVSVTFIQRDCNYLQALEGEIDTAHFGYLHAGHVDPDDVPEDSPVYHTITHRAPEYHIADAPWGTQYAAYRPAGEDSIYWRFANFLFPFWVQVPAGEFASHIHARARGQFGKRVALAVLSEMDDLEISRAHQTLAIGAADMETARNLGIALNAPTAEARCVVTDAGGTVIYVGEITYPGDCVRLNIELIGAKSG